jgi:hypothetical protein
MSTEQQLAELFDEQARQAPAPDALLDGALRKVRTRRRRLAAAVGGTAVLSAAVVLAAGLSLGGGPSAPIAGPSPSGTVPAGRAGQPIAVAGVSTSCVYGYSPELVAEKMDFAFDGTVVSVGAPVSQRPGDPLPWDYAGVTFRVNEWFKGGSGDTITVDLPRSGQRLSEDEGSPSEYAPGTRLLVSGMARWGGSNPLAYPVAWFGCGGFTLYYGDSVADSWRAANR